MVLINNVPQTNLMEGIIYISRKLTCCFKIFFPIKGNAREADALTLIPTLPSNLSRSGSFRRYRATTNIISECAIRSSTALSLLLMLSTSFSGWQIQLLNSRLPDDVTQLSRYLNNVPGTHSSRTFED